MGGFGGGPGQFPHLAPTYAAVNALVILGTEEAYKVIDRSVIILLVASFGFSSSGHCRKRLYEFLKSVKQPDGSFCMHAGGEVDIRGAYCALSVASMTDILTKDLTDNTAEWIVRLDDLVNLNFDSFH